MLSLGSKVRHNVNLDDDEIVRMLLWDSNNSGCNKMAYFVSHFVIKRKRTSIEKGSEMVSECFSTKKAKFEHLTNGEPVRVEVRTTLKRFLWRYDF